MCKRVLAQWESGERTESKKQKQQRDERVTRSKDGYWLFFRSNRKRLFQSVQLVKSHFCYSLYDFQWWKDSKFKKINVRMKQKSKLAKVKILFLGGR